MKSDSWVGVNHLTTEKKKNPITPFWVAWIRGSRPV